MSTFAINNKYDIRFVANTLAQGIQDNDGYFRLSGQKNRKKV